MPRAVRAWTYRPDGSTDPPNEKRADWAARSLNNVREVGEAYFSSGSAVATDFTISVMRLRRFGFLIE